MHGKKTQRETIKEKRIMRRIRENERLVWDTDIWVSIRAGKLQLLLKYPMTSVRVVTLQVNNMQLVAVHQVVRFGFQT